MHKTQRSFIEKISSNKGNTFLLHASDNGEPCWYYLEVWDEKLKEFEKLAMLKKAIVVSDFGRVIHSGYGENPPEHITKTLKNIGAI